MPFLYRITSCTNHVSISRLYRAFEAVIRRHNILRTSLYLDTNGTIVQRSLDTIVTDDDMKSYGFSVKNLSRGDNDDDQTTIDGTINDIINDCELFDLSQGRVIYCHILCYSRPNDDLLSKDDCILFCIHHCAFDRVSIPVFFHHLSVAYESDSPLPLNDNSLQYIDYAVYERLIDTTSSQQFWHSQLVGYNLQRSLSLPVDRHRSSTDQRSGLAFVAQISFNNEISAAFFHYASLHQVTPFQLGLATFYAFLFKLTYGESDLCVTFLNANRYRSELEEMIGMFVGILPYRIQLDSQWSFDQLVKHVREKCLSILEHSHYSLQHILADFELNYTNILFQEIAFDFIPMSSYVDSFSLNHSSLKQLTIRESCQFTLFDFSMTFLYNSTSDDNQLSCSLTCSHDIFDITTVALISKRFEYFFDQIFQTCPKINLMDNWVISMKKLSVILSEEAAEIEATLFHNSDNIIEEGMCLINS